MTQQEQEERIIYDQEVQKLEESTGEINYFKPVKGKNKLKIDEEPVVKKKEKEWDDEPQEYVEIPVTTVDDEGEKQEMVWEMRRSRTLSSKWGQLVQYGKHMDGLKGELINWFVQGEGKDTTHTLLDLADIDASEKAHEPESVDEKSEAETDEKESVF